MAESLICNEFECSYLSTNNDSEVKMIGNRMLAGRMQVCFFFLTLF